MSKHHFYIKFWICHLIEYILSISKIDKPSAQPSLKPSRPSFHPTQLPTGQPTSRPSHFLCEACTSGLFYDLNLKAGGGPYLAAGGTASAVVGCAPCTPGYTCVGGCNSPQPCAIGTYTANYGALTCNNCGGGSYNLVKAASNCTSCPAGSSCATSNTG